MKSLKINLNSVPVEAKPKQLKAQWTLKNDIEFVMRWLSLHTDYQLVMSMLNNGGMEAIEHIGFDRLEELAEAFPSLAKRLADPTNWGRNAQNI